MKWFIGIDPGLDGAIAIIEEDGDVKVYDTPTLKIGNKRGFMLQEMVNILRPIAIGPFYTAAAVEKVHSMPRQGVASAFSFGKGVGYWEGVLAALQIPYEEVTPQRWQGVMMDGMQKTKDASRLRAMQLFPQLADQLKLKSNDGRADALLIALWRRRQG